MGFADCVMAMVRFQCGVRDSYDGCIVFRRRGYQQLRMKFGCVWRYD